MAIGGGELVSGIMSLAERGSPSSNPHEQAGFPLTQSKGDLRDSPVRGMSGHSEWSQIFMFVGVSTL